MKSKILFIVLALILIAAAAVGGYLFGVKAGEARANVARAAFFAERGAATLSQSRGMDPLGTGVNRGSNVTRPSATGEVVKVHNDRLELNTGDSTVNILVNDQTIIRKTTIFSLADIQPGEQITVIGDRDVNGNIVARSIQVGEFPRPSR